MADVHLAKRRKISPPLQAQTAVPGFARWNIEQDYEKRPRKSRKEAKSDPLTVRTAEGWTSNLRLASNKQEQDDGEEDHDSFLGSDDNEESVVGNDQATVSIVPEPSISPQQAILQAQEELAKIASSVSEDPEENVAQLSRLTELARSVNPIVKKLALGTQLAIYKDIIPGYRIRPLSKEERDGKISKDIRKLRNFEQGLLTAYKEYISTLASLTNIRGRSTADAAGLASVATLCACTLLNTAPHFNCRDELLNIIVKRLSSRRADADFIRCRDSLEQLFREDQDGHGSLEAVTQLTQMMKTRDYQIHEQTLNTFLHLRLLSEFSHKASTNKIDRDGDETKPRMKKSQREFRTKREKKRAREVKEVAKEMREADATVSHEERDKNQSETLKLVFVAYFRILKGRIPHLMGAVLEGLAKYAHLINQDFFGDILEALKYLINDAESLIYADGDEAADIDVSMQRNVSREALLCVITAFALLHGQYDVSKSANALSLDLSFFITHLYRSLLSLAMNADLELSAKTAHLQDPNDLSVPQATNHKVNVSTTTVLLLRSLQSILLPPTNTRAVPPVRVAAFVKQLMSLCLHVPQKSATALLGLLQQVTKTHSNKVASLWHTEERKGDGVFDAENAEVESSNPFAASVWEGELLRLHFDPTIRSSARAVEKNAVVLKQ